MPDDRPQEHDISPSPSPLRVLLVEDDAITLEFITRFLTDAGASVTEAMTARQAIEMAREHEPFDLLLTDYTLPDGTGLEVASAVRGRAQHVLLVSGEIASLPLREARAAGVTRFMPKYELDGPRIRELLVELFGRR